jgi:chromosome partitioning protein
LLRNAATVKPDLRVFILTCRKQANNNLMRDSRQAAEAFFQLEGLAVQFLETEIYNRIAYAEAVGAGKSVLDHAAGSKAAEEVLRLSQEVVECLSAKAAG